MRNGPTNKFYRHEIQNGRQNLHLRGIDGQVSDFPHIRHEREGHFGHLFPLVRETQRRSPCTNAAQKSP
jgi:hypothetical protein